jgi:hypothetical protein
MYQNRGIIALCRRSVFENHGGEAIKQANMAVLGLGIKSIAGQQWDDKTEPAPHLGGNRLYMN